MTVFHTPTVTDQQFDQIERKGGDNGAGLLRGVKVAMLGEAKGHGVKLDDTTLEQIVTLGEAGAMKSRFTHPNASGDGMGKLLGRPKNFRRDGEAVYADLHFYKSAHNTPNGDLANYVMDLAEESPGDFGASIAFEYEGGAPPDEPGAPVRLAALDGFDVVDNPAATDGFFSTGGGDDPARHATRLLDTYFGDTAPDQLKSRVDGFLSRYFANKGIPMPDTNTTDPPAVDAEQFAALQVETEQLKAQLAALQQQDPPADPTQLSAADVDKLVDERLGEALSAETTRCNEIRAKCEQANLPQLSAGFIDDRSFTVEKVERALFNAMTGINPPVGEGNGDPPATADPDAEFKAEYKAQKATFSELGVSEEDYVASRRIDAGTDKLEVGSAAAAS